MGDTMSALAKHVKTTEAGNKIFLENASPTDGIDERTPAGRLFSPGHSIGMRKHKRNLGCVMIPYLHL